MSDNWQTISSRPIYRNKWFTVEEDLVKLPNKKVTTFTIVKTAMPTTLCVGIVPLTESGEVILVRQYRYRFKFYNWEIPTGIVDEGETIEKAALRELQEEIGYTADRLIPLVKYHPNMSIIQTAHIFLAKDLRHSPIDVDDEGEFIVETKKFRFEDVFRMALHGELRDSLSIIGILYTHLRNTTGH